MIVRCLFVLLGLSLTIASTGAQTPAPPAVDVTAAAVKAFIDKLPKDRISDSPIRVADVGGYKVGVYGVFRPKSQPGGAIRHETSVTEIYYMLEGTATLVTAARSPTRRAPARAPTPSGRTSAAAESTAA